MAIWSLTFRCRLTPGPEAISPNSRVPHGGSWKLLSMPKEFSGLPIPTRRSSRRSGAQSCVLAAGIGSAI
eukprot:11216839-Lingulodinium_polyedra.AAC.1